MPAGAVTATVTGDTGAGQQMTAQSFPNVAQAFFDFVGGVVKLNQTDPPRTVELQYSNLTGVTFTPASKTISMTDV